MRKTKKRTLLLPRGYLSWSQVDLWLKNPRKYIDRYVYDGAQETSVALEFGKRASEALENNEETGDFLTDIVLARLPKYDKSEHEIDEWFEGPDGYFMLKGKLDTFDTKTINFREYKTGNAKWTQKRANGHKQLHHYQTLLWLRYKKLAEDIHLDWAETTDEEEGGRCFTGNIHTFKVHVGLQDVLTYLALVSRVAREIEQAYKNELEKHAKKER